MYSGRLSDDEDVPEIAMELLPNKPIIMVCTLAVNCTVDITAPFDRATVAVRTRLVQKELFDAICESKMFLASVTPTPIGPSEYMVIAAWTAGDAFATAPTLAA